ncbi:MAG: RNA-binding transcriptional accessory protein [Bacteroidales bacterium]|nr:RNA-binding transcriptional accessory protein [Bacteroidales bacterium]
MQQTHVKIIANQLQLTEDQVYNTIELFENGATIPFISRYRKELTGSLNEVVLANIHNLWEKLIEIDKRKETILRTIEEQGKLTDELRKQIENTYDTNELEDLYLPYKPKRKTRASIARQKGLEPLATTIYQQKSDNIEATAANYLNDEVKTIEEAIEGALDIIAEWISENQQVRQSIRNLFTREATVISKVVKGKEPDAIKYGDYFDFQEPLKRCPSHRYLAMNRGESEGYLRISIEVNESKAIETINRLVIKSRNNSGKLVEKAVVDSYKRLIAPSMENEFKALAKEKADDEAIKVFAENLQQLLLAPPLGQKRVLAIDPGFRTGCKVVCLDAEGNLLHNETIYPHPPQNERGQAAAKINSLVKTYKIEAIAIGNGTASRETEHFIKTVRFDTDVKVFIVNESGASVYSASAIAREEFPDYDVTVRGAVSIGRRLMDPLAELVKIDPKSIGVGQYQHDVDQGKLKKSLEQVVEFCVNMVGVNVNTASKELLTYVSGVGPTLAQNIVKYRRENGPFNSRQELLKVPRLGEKVFEQCAGFLRIRNGIHPLDNSAVHPESYPIVEKMAADLNTSIEALLKDENLRNKIDINRYVTDKVGLPTLNDILQELARPGLDPRTVIKIFEFDPNVHTIDDLKVGMILPGIVTNITRFGCFVDIGIHQDGLVHISQMADRYISDPLEIVKIHQHVRVKVIEIDKVRNRIQLSMKGIEKM